MQRIRQLQQENDTKSNTSSLRFPDVKAKSQPLRPQRLLANIVALARASVEPSLQQETPLLVDQGPKKRAWDCTLFPSAVQAARRDLKRNGLLEPIPKIIASSESSTSFSTDSLSNSVSPLQWAAARADSITPDNHIRRKPAGENMMIQEFDQDDSSQSNTKCSIRSPKS